MRDAVRVGRLPAVVLESVADGWDGNRPGVSDESAVAIDVEGVAAGLGGRAQVDGAARDGDGRPVLADVSSTVSPRSVRLPACTRMVG